MNVKQALQVAQADFVAKQIKWQRLVAPRWRYLDETPTHCVFLHPTKGKRFVSKRRLGL